jgi:hypothetical protein
MALHAKAIRRHIDIMHPFEGQRILDADLDNHPVGGPGQNGAYRRQYAGFRFPSSWGFSGYPVNFPGRNPVVNPGPIGPNSIFGFLLPVLSQ